MHASTADDIFCLCFDIFQIVVVYVVYSMEESQSTIPAAISLLMSHIFDPLLHVHLCGSCAIQEICFCGSLIILICRFEIDGSVRLALELIGHLICESIKRSCLSWHLIFPERAVSSCMRSLPSGCVHEILPPHCGWGRWLSHDLICVAIEQCWSSHLYWVYEGMEWWNLHSWFGPPCQLLMLCIPWCWELRHVVPPL